ncbi:hypothetical protein J14TS5_02710 [Paenibacillus lautus]|nr:hypothetical protein J14TS5_02710 [Paenibacillus lautus]
MPLFQGNPRQHRRGVKRKLTIKEGIRMTLYNGGSSFLSAYDAEYETFYMILRISVKAMKWKGAL